MNKSLLLAALFALSIAACSKTEKPAEPAPAAAAPAVEAPAAAADTKEAVKDASEAVKDAVATAPAADAAKK